MGQLSTDKKKILRKKFQKNYSKIFYLVWKFQKKKILPKNSKILKGGKNKQIFQNEKKTFQIWREHSPAKAKKFHDLDFSKKNHENSFEDSKSSNKQKLKLTAIRMTCLNKVLLNFGDEQVYLEEFWHYLLQNYISSFFFEVNLRESNTNLKNFN